MIPLNLYRTWIYDSVETTHEFIRLIRYNFWPCVQRFDDEHDIINENAVNVTIDYRYTAYRIS